MLLKKRKKLKIRKRKKQKIRKKRKKMNEQKKEQVLFFQFVDEKEQLLLLQKKVMVAKIEKLLLKQ